MKLTWKVHELRLKFPFRIARGIRETVPVIIVEIGHDGLVGRGEASPTPRYGESLEGSVRFLQQCGLEAFSSPWLREDIITHLDQIETGNHAIKCALDVALHDWMGQALQMPLHRLWGLDAKKSAPCSFTIGIGDENEIRQKLAEAEPYPILKIKLGSDQDEMMMDTIRSLTDKTLYVDVNEGWKTRDLALQRMDWLRQYDIQFVEQPMPADQWDDLYWLQQHSELPIFADESLGRLDQLTRIAPAFNGINIKLNKCTGLREALKIITLAHALDLKIMLGCMIESSVGISAAAQLTPLVDYADLDGNILITNDPYDGIRNTLGQLVLNDRPGIGVAEW